MCSKQILVNDKSIDQKLLLKDGDIINILDKRFQWKDERKSKSKMNDGNLWILHTFRTKHKSKNEIIFYFIAFLGTPGNSGQTAKEAQMTASVPAKASRRSVKSTINSILSKFSKRITVDR